MSVKKNKKRWTKFRHRVIRAMALPVLYPVMKIKYHVSFEKFKEQGKRQYIILVNHQTAFDQFFISAMFNRPVYYVASEDLFSNGFVSSLIRYLVAPIPIKKQTTDVSAVMNCLRVAKEGGTIAICPEGNRTYSGKTEYINPAISSLVKKLKLPIAFVKIEGGYGVQPRWSDITRKGKMHVRVSRVLEPEEYQDVSKEDLYQIIKQELYVSEANSEKEFFHKKSAEYLERAMYVCPYCGLSEFESKNDTIKCKKCNRTIRYLPNKQLKGDGFDFPFSFVNDWYEYQNEYVCALSTDAFKVKPAYVDNVKLSEVIVYKKKRLLDKNAVCKLYSNKIVISKKRSGENVFDFNEVTAVTVLGRNKLNVYYKDRIFQLKGSKRFNALKYVNFFYHYKNDIKGECDGKFLGL